MSMARGFVVLAACLFATASASIMVVDNVNSVESMQKTFQRSAKTHKASMAAIMASMSSTEALQILEKNNKTTPQLLSVAKMVLSNHKHLRKQPKGYSGIDGARKMLNDMIFESMSKYDAEIAKCTEYYAEQCAAMEVCRGQIAASNYIAANSRMLILDSQATINKCEVDIPTTKWELKKHELKCKQELAKMNVRLKIILGDIAIMTVILKMTDCDAKKSFVQRNVMRCKDRCTGKSFITFNDKELKKSVSQLQSTMSHDLMQDTFQDLFDGVKDLEEVEMRQSPIINKTNFSNPPVPRTPVPLNPCSDPNKGAPVPSGACQLSPGQCYKLQERFLLIQLGIQDERDELLQ
jgi:hypothetical protein